MVYINDASGTVTIPRHYSDNSEYYTIELSSNMVDEFRLVHKAPNISTNPLYYKFSFYTSLDTGEYNYTLFDDRYEVIETGLLTYGDYNRGIGTYNKIEIEKIQYNG